MLSSLDNFITNSSYSLYKARLLSIQDWISVNIAFSTCSRLPTDFKRALITFIYNLAVFVKVYDTVEIRSLLVEVKNVTNYSINNIERLEELN